MVLALNSIWNEGNWDLRVENYRDHWGRDIPPYQPAFIGARWVDKGRDRTVLTIRDPAPPAVAFSDLPSSSRPPPQPRRAAVISFEDIRWQLVMKGDVEGGSVAVDVDGNKDFDIVVKADGEVLVRCLGGSFNPLDMQVVLRVPSLQDPVCSGDLSSDPDYRETYGALSASIPASPTRDQNSLPPHPLHAVAGSALLYDPLDQHCGFISNHLSQPSRSGCSTPPPSFPPASYSMSEISTDLALLLEELRADQRAILQKEFQMVGASFGERLWMGGRKLMGTYEPKELLPQAMVINILVIPAIFLFTYLYNHHRHRKSLACSTLFPSPGHSSPTTRRSNSGRSIRSVNDHYFPDQFAGDAVPVLRTDGGEDQDGLPPPPYSPSSA